MIKYGRSSCLILKIGSGKQLPAERSPENAFYMLHMGTWMPSKESERKNTGGILALLLSLPWPATPGELVCKERNGIPIWSGEEQHEKILLKKKNILKRENWLFQTSRNPHLIIKYYHRNKWCFLTWNHFLCSHFFLLR